jgi:hypothetical protein
MKERANVPELTLSRGGRESLSDGGLAKVLELRARDSDYFACSISGGFLLSSSAKLP